MDFNRKHRNIIYQSENDFNINVNYLVNLVSKLFLYLVLSNFKVKRYFLTNFKLFNLGEHNRKENFEISLQVETGKISKGLKFDFNVKLQKLLGRRRKTKTYTHTHIYTQVLDFLSDADHYRKLRRVQQQATTLGV